MTEQTDAAEVEALAEIVEGLTDLPLAWDFFPDPDAALDDVARYIAAREAAARAEALREAADGLYLSRPGQHNEGAKDWLHRRANLIDPRTRDTVCEHGYSRSVECGYCEEIASIARTDGAGS